MQETVSDEARGDHWGVRSIDKANCMKCTTNAAVTVTAKRNVSMCCSDRYKVFIDLFNLSTYIVPRSYTPQLTQRMQRSLSVIAIEQLSEPFDDDEDEAGYDDDATKNLLKLHIY